MRWHHKPQPADVRLHVCYHFPPLDCLLQAVTSSGQRVDIIVGVDTVVESAGVILEKPDDAEHALRMLQSLSGGRHYVHTGVVLKFMDGSSHSFHETTQIQFAAVCTEASVYLNVRSRQQHHMFVQALQAYVATGEVCRRVRLSDVEFALLCRHVLFKESTMCFDLLPLIVFSRWTKLEVLAFKVFIASQLQPLCVRLPNLCCRRRSSLHIRHQRLLLQRHGIAAAQILFGAEQVAAPACPTHTNSAMTHRDARSART
jgi:hypothetical protein